MKFLLPAAALLALALTACQAEPSLADAQAAASPAAADPVVATAVSDMRSAAIDPATGKARDAGAVFIAASDTATAAAPGVTLGSVAPGAPSPTLDLQPGTTGTGAPSL
jgi:hypothetical protein